MAMIILPIAIVSIAIKPFESPAPATKVLEPLTSINPMRHHRLTAFALALTPFEAASIFPSLGRVNPGNIAYFSGPGEETAAFVVATIPVARVPLTFLPCILSKAVHVALTPLTCV